MAIHPTAIIDARAELAADVEIGPYAVIEGPVQVGPRTRIYSNVYLSGWTTIGSDCQIHPGAVVGHLPQDFHYGGDKSYCRVGDRTVVREFASVHRGTQPESTTEVGSDCFILGYSHVGHNCVLDRGVKLYNGALLAGHVEVGPGAIISGNSVVHQFVRIGDLAMIGGASRINQDIPPYLSYAPETGLYGVNSIGLKRAEMPAEAIRELGELYRLLFRSGLPLRRAVEKAAATAGTEAGRKLVAFCRAASKRGIAGGPGRKRTRHVSGEAPA